MCVWMLSMCLRNCVKVCLVCAYACECMLPMSIRAYTCIYLCKCMPPVFICSYVCIYLCLCLYVHMCVYTCLCECMTTVLICTCVCMHLCECMPQVFRCRWRPGEGVRSPGSGVCAVVNCLCGCWEPKGSCVRPTNTPNTELSISPAPGCTELRWKRLAIKIRLLK